MENETGQQIDIQGKVQNAQTNKGNKKVLIITIVSALVLALFGFFFTKNNKSPKTSSTTTSVENKLTESGSADSKVSVMDLFKKGGNFKCTYNTDVAGSGSMNAEVFVSGKKIRVNSQGKSDEGTPYSSSMIMDDDYYYIWSDNEKTGIKMAATTNRETPDIEEGQAQYADLNEKFDYKCDNWNADLSVFTPPTNINFSDTTQLQNDQCAACDMLTGDQKDTCRKSLNCE